MTECPARKGPARASAHAGRTIVSALATVLIISGLLTGIAVLRGGQRTVGDGLPLARPQAVLAVAGSEQRLLLGTPQGLFRSGDGGRSWRRASFTDNDVLGLAQGRDGMIWAAGHLVLATSTDGGQSWNKARPRGLPSLDVHGFALDPVDPSRVWAAIGGEGLFLSTDGGRSYVRRSREVGPDVVSLAVTHNGTLLAGDAARGALVASYDGGATWTTVIAELPTSVAAHPTNIEQVIAAAGDVLLSSDGGRNWRRAPEIGPDAVAVAWESGWPSPALVAAASGTLWRSDAGAQAWTPIVRGRSAGG